MSGVSFSSCSSFSSINSFSLIFSSCYSQIDSEIFFGILISHGIIFFIPVSVLFSVEFFESLPLLRFICRLFFYRLRFSLISQFVLYIKEVLSSFFSYSFCKYLFHHFYNLQFCILPLVRYALFAMSILCQLLFLYSIFLCESFSAVYTSDSSFAGSVLLTNLQVRLPLLPG